MSDSSTNSLNAHRAALPTTTPQVDAAPDETNVPFWTPTWAESLQSLGWRWLYFVPGVIAVIGAVAMFRLSIYQFPLMILTSKILVILICLPITAAFGAMRKTVQRRTEPFCIHCGYTLLGLADGARCPECGRRFSLAIIDEYRRDPRWFASRWKANRLRPPAGAPFNAGAVRGKPSRDGT